MHWLGVRARDRSDESIRDYLSKTENDHERAALIFALAAFTVPFLIVGTMVFAWMLFFE